MLHIYIFSALFLFLASWTRSNGTLNLIYVFYHIIRKKTEINIEMLLLNTVACVSPMILFQGFAYHQFCYKFQSFRGNFSLDHLPNWCWKTIPFSYSEIQLRYWNVELFGYWNWDNWIPFGLAAPIIGN